MWCRCLWKRSSCDGSSGGGRLLKISSSKEELKSLGQTINFIDNWLHFSEVNHNDIIESWKQKMKELLKIIPKYIPPKKSDDYIYIYLDNNQFIRWEIVYWKYECQYTVGKSLLMESLLTEY